MMNLYYVKKGAGLFGVPDDTVERFHTTKGEALRAEGKLEAYDDKKHSSKVGAPPYEARKAEERAAARAQETAAREQAVR